MDTNAETKTCSRCREMKPMADFTRDSRAKDGHYLYCRECKRAEWQVYSSSNNKEKIAAKAHAYYAADPAKILTRNRQYWAARPEEYAAFKVAQAQKSIARGLARVNALKTPCAVCGEDYPPAIDFHHLDPTSKEMNVSGLTRSRPGVLETEVGKCICLCASCHRKYHASHPEVVERIEAYRRDPSP